ncbi:hypothetical protein FOVG_19689 [Fusarium oxysporum f. sp. pisi HDV247]|uniref:Uncharacterized protein n=1 Tax=Fusarium oxysporum f. sp. pisi HDV247 TaxID=1080344 RepID=W9N7L3_FUSOX|nr:hypothetical protein FOVG_19689 [Fusarium oxysporum f. sp. pisi HDV247]
MPQSSVLSLCYLKNGEFSVSLGLELGSSVCEVGSSIPVHEDSEIKHQGQQNQH